jgi:hypothetical protein
MAKISKPNPLSYWGFTTPTPLNSTLNQLREVSGDDTPLTDNYVSFYRNVYDMIANGGGSGTTHGVTDITYNENNNTLEITYSNQPSKIINLIDKFLSTVSFNEATNIITFTLNDSTTINLDLTVLMDKVYDKEYIDNTFYDKDTVDDKISKANVVWNDF